MSSVRRQQARTLIDVSGNCIFPQLRSMAFMVATISHPLILGPHMLDPPLCNDQHEQKFVEACVGGGGGLKDPPPTPPKKENN
jgi:hypothetical protein